MFHEQNILKWPKIVLKSRELRYLSMNLYPHSNCNAICYCDNFQISTLHVRFSITFLFLVGWLVFFFFCFFPSYLFFGLVFFPPRMPCRIWWGFLLYSLFRLGNGNLTSRIFRLTLFQVLLLRHWWNLAGHDLALWFQSIKTQTIYVIWNEKVGCLVVGFEAEKKIFSQRSIHYETSL